MSQIIVSRKSGMELMSIAQSRASLLSSNMISQKASCVTSNQFFIRRLAFGFPQFGAGNGGKRPQINMVSWSRVDCGVGYRKER